MEKLDIFKTPKELNCFGIIYIITNEINKKIYIGQTILSVNKRFRGHVNNKSNKTCLLTRAIKKYGESNFSLNILSLAKDKYELDDMEIEHISNYSNTHSLYNLSPGGQYRKLFTEETRKKISEGLKNKPKSKEHCEAVSKAKKGIKVNPIYAKKHKELMKVKFAKPIFALDKDGNKFFFEGAHDASRKLGYVVQKIRHSLRKEYIIDNKYIFFYTNNIENIDIVCFKNKIQNKLNRLGI